MKLSTKSRYGTRAVLDIALHVQGGPVKLNDIAARQGVSKKYLGQIINQLLAAGILESIRGPRGGYIMGRPPEQTSVGDIIRILDGPLAPVRCAEKPDSCRRTGDCAMREVWVKVKEGVESVVDNVTIADVMSRQKALQGIVA
jgi:Rrf2 family protein